MVTTNGVVSVLIGGLVVVVVAMHSNVLPVSWGTAVGQTTLEWRWRSLRMLCSIDTATRAVFKFVFVTVEVEEVDDEPHALTSATQASAVTAVVAPRRTLMTRTRIGVGGWMCMRRILIVLDARRTMPRG